MWFFLLLKLTPPPRPPSLQPTWCSRQRCRRRSRRMSRPRPLTSSRWHLFRYECVRDWRGGGGGEVQSGSRKDFFFFFFFLRGREVAPLLTSFLPITLPFPATLTNLLSFVRRFYFYFFSHPSPQKRQQLQGVQAQQAAIIQHCGDSTYIICNY